MALDLMEYADDPAAQSAYVTVGKKAVTFVADAQLDTAQKKFGSASLLLDGTGDLISLADSTDWEFDADFTLDFQVRFNALPGNGIYVYFMSHHTIGSPEAGSWIFDLYNSAGTYYLEFYWYTTSWQYYQVAWTPSVNTWYHLELVRTGTTLKIFVDGTQVGTNGTCNYNLAKATVTLLYIGAGSGGAQALNGWIDEVRISKAIARNTANFTAPTVPYQTDSYTKLLLHFDGSDGAKSTLDSSALDSYSESTIKQQGSYALKGIAINTVSDNDTLTRTVSPTIDLSNINTIRFDIRSSRTGTNIKIRIRDSGGTITEITPNITSANTWQTVDWDISGVSNANKDAIDRIIIIITNAAADNTFYIDNMREVIVVSVSALALTLALQAPTVKWGSTVKPSAIALILTIQTPTLQYDYVIKPSALALALALQTPTISAYKFVFAYRVELRDKSGNLKQYLTPWVESLSWEWNRIGGCGRCRIKLAMQYKKVAFKIGDDIQIKVESAMEAKLVYRGWIAYITPSLQIGENISLDIRGYSDKLKTLVVHSAGGAKTYTSQQISAIVTDIVDNFIVPNSDITKGTIDASSFEADTLSFKADVAEVLETLADLLGNVEYGVDENRVFFWRNESTSLRHKFFVGYDVERYERREDGDSLLNKIYFEGGKVGGVPFTRTAEITESQDRYYLAEGIIVNSAITTTSVADQYLTSILQRYAEPKVKIRIKIPNTPLRLEDTLPLGMIAIHDPDFVISIYIWGKSASGGSNLIWGKTASGGSNKQWGGLFKDQIDRIDYQISDTEERTNVEIATGGGILAASAQLKRIELVLSGLRQRD